MLCFLLKMSFFAVLMLELRFLSRLSQLTQIIFAVERQFYPQRERLPVLRESYCKDGVSPQGCMVGGGEATRTS